MEGSLQNWMDGELHPASTSENVGAPPEHWAACQTALGAVIGRDLFIEHAPSAGLLAHVSSGVAGSHVLAHGSPASTTQIAQPNSESQLCQSSQ